MLNNTDLEKKINSELNTKVSSSKIVHETLNVSIEKDDLKEVLLFLKSNPDMKFKQLIDITAVDYPDKKNRFRMVYLLLSHEFNKRVIIDFTLNENDKVFSIGRAGKYDYQVDIDDCIKQAMIMKDQIKNGTQDNAVPGKEYHFPELKEEN